MKPNFVIYIFIALRDILCDNTDWSIWKGDWNFDSNPNSISDCSISNTDGSGRELIWYGNEDGTIIDIDYEHELFILETEVEC